MASIQSWGTSYHRNRETCGLSSVIGRDNERIVVTFKQLRGDRMVYLEVELTHEEARELAQNVNTALSEMK